MKRTPVIAGRVAALATVVLSLMLISTTPASAVMLDLNSVNIQLSGPGPSTWDPTLTTTPCTTVAGWSPADDGAYDLRSDAFDGSLVVGINGTGYTDTDGWVLVGPGEQVATYGDIFSGLTVSRLDTALQSSTTMRSIIVFTNKTAARITEPITIETNLGSDTGTTIVSTSSGDILQQRKDRWVVTDDGSPTTGDPIVTLAYYGMGRTVLTPTSLDQSANAGNDCEVLTYTLSVKAGQTKNLMFFAELHTGTRAAKRSAPRYNTIAPGSPLLAGLSKGTLSHIVNWNV